MFIPTKPWDVGFNMCRKTQKYLKQTKQTKIIANIPHNSVYF